MKKPVTMTVIVILIIVVIAHLIRLAFGIEIIVQDLLVPQWLRIPGFLVPTALAALLWRERNLN